MTIQTDMGTESFLLVNLKDEKSKKLAQAISNESCRKILDYLTGKESATESEIAKELGVPISTVHYNLANLGKAGLVEAEEYHYSSKGKEVNHYRLAKKFIIIAPSGEKADGSFMEKLKSVLPLGIFAAVGTGMLYAWQLLKSGGKSFATGGMDYMAKSAPEMTRMATDEAVTESAEAGAQFAAQPAADTLSQTAQASASEPNIAMWFLAGTIFMILVVLIINLIKGNKK